MSDTNDTSVADAGDTDEAQIEAEETMADQATEGLTEAVT